MQAQWKCFSKMADEAGRGDMEPCICFCICVALVHTSEMQMQAQMQENEIFSISCVDACACVTVVHTCILSAFAFSSHM